MLDEQGTQNFFRQMHEMYIRPELDKRFGETGVPIDFKIWQCLIKLPKDAPPIIEFNDEIGWATSNPKLAPGIEMEIGKTIYLHELKSLGKVLPPSVDDKRVAFVFLFWNGFNYHCYFDFLPNQPDYNPADERFHFDDTVIINYLNQFMIEKVVRLGQNAQDKLRESGLWIITALLPHPMSKLIELVGSGKLNEANQLLVDHCNKEFISQLVNTWTSIKPFHDRLPLFREVVFAHSNGMYRLSISTLIPHIEGVITDWLYTLNIRVKSDLENKMPRFRSIILEIPQFEFAYREAFESSVGFVLDGPPLQKIKKWMALIDPSFVARHAIAHGKYQDDIFTEENSIKLFLLLDDICQFMMFYEMRVLKKDLGQNVETPS